jgi:hypothetical protein
VIKDPAYHEPVGERRGFCKVFVESGAYRLGGMKVEGAGLEADQ